MSTAAAQAAAFYREVAKHGSLWTVRDSGGFPQPKNSSGRRAQPLWSLRSRAERVVKTAAAYYSEFEVVEVPWDAFVSRWVPGLKRGRVLVGVNWSGSIVSGYDIPPDDVVRNVRAVADPGSPVLATPPLRSKAPWWRRLFRR
jgi:Protein of unknown function (DUF2750)